MGLVQFLIGLVVAMLLLQSIPTVGKNNLVLKVGQQKQAEIGVSLENKRYVSEVTLFVGSFGPNNNNV